jgi:hypothetical protein
MYTGSDGGGEVMEIPNLTCAFVLLGNESIPVASRRKKIP